MEAFMESKSRQIGYLGALILLALVNPGTSTSNQADTPGACDGKPYVVKIHADWCGACKALEPVWAQIETELSDQATVVSLDVTDRVGYSKSVATAERLGISEFFREYRRRTGTIAVLDCKTRKTVAIMNAEHDLEKYRQAVARARIGS